MLKVNTTKFGEIEIKDVDTIVLPSGLIGFPELKKYVILDHDKDSPFKWLQSVEDGAIAFVLMNPMIFKPDYLVEVADSEIAELEVQSEEDLVISVIVTVPSNPQNMTANLKAPLIFNLKNRKGKQVILNTSAYTTRHNILEEFKKRTQNQEQEELQKIAEQSKSIASTETAVNETAQSGKK